MKPYNAFGTIRTCRPLAEKLRKGDIIQYELHLKGAPKKEIVFTPGRPYSLTTGRDDFDTGFANARPAGVGRNTLQGPIFGGLETSHWRRQKTKSLRP